MGETVTIRRVPRLYGSWPVVTRPTSRTTSGVWAMEPIEYYTKPSDGIEVPMNDATASTASNRPGPMLRPGGLSRRPRSGALIAGACLQRFDRDAGLLHGQIVYDASDAGNPSGDFGGPRPHVVAVDDTAEVDDVLVGRDTDVEGLQA